jgi:hypothetical protein
MVEVTIILEDLNILNAAKLTKLRKNQKTLLLDIQLKDTTLTFMEDSGLLCLMTNQTYLILLEVLEQDKSQIVKSLSQLIQD